jgi:hypothetical protein
MKFTKESFDRLVQAYNLTYGGQIEASAISSLEESHIYQCLHNAKVNLEMACSLYSDNLERVTK